MAYWGPAFRGFQSQSGGGSVQDELEAVFQKITGESRRLHGAGRTDAGVHAAGQVVHFDLPAGWRMTSRQWRDAFNSSLPATLRVLKAGFRKAPWHARYNALAKTYRYDLCVAEVLPPALHQLAWHVFPTPDFARLQEVLRGFVGAHDFSSFSPRRLAPGKSGLRNLYDVRIRTLPGLRWRIEFTGDGFLYKMVRMLVGTAVYAARGKLDPAEIQAALTDPAPATFSIVAPAHGLTLDRVYYRTSLKFRQSF